jgi:putative ABC transport system ATP-binding protein
VTATVVRMRDVRRTYGQHAPVHALRQADLDIVEGDYVAITGPSGSGKSTLLNLLGLLDRATAGEQTLRGRDVVRMSERERTAVRGTDIGFVFQSFHLLPSRSVVENVELGLLYRAWPRAHRRSSALGAIDAVGLSRRRHALAGDLSGGEAQRVAVARAVVGQPPLLLCDEPTGNLDSTSSESLLDLLGELRATWSITLAVVTHDPRVAARAERLVEVRDGVVHGGVVA